MGDSGKSWVEMAMPGHGAAEAGGWIRTEWVSLGIGRHVWIPVVVLLPWGMMLGIYYFGPIAFRPLSETTWLFLGLALGIFLIAFELGWRWRRREGAAAKALPTKWYRRLVVTSVLGGALMLIDYLHAGFTPTLASRDPLEARALQGEHLTSWVTTLAFPFAAVALSCALLALRRWCRKSRDVWTWAGLLSPLFLFGTNMLQAGRQTFVIAFCLMVSMFLLEWVRGTFRPRFTRVVKALPFIGVGMGLVISYFSFIAVNRNASSVTAINVLHRFGVNTRPSVDGFFVRRFSSETLVSVYSGLYYYSHQLSGLDSDLSAGIGPDGWGRAVLGWPILQLTRFGVDLRYDPSALQAARVASGDNLWGWGTGFETVLADFGFVGALVFAGAMAFLLGRFSRTAVVSGADADVAVACWWLAAFLFSIEFFPGDGVFTLNTVLCLMLRRVRWRHGA